MPAINFLTSIEKKFLICTHEIRNGMYLLSSDPVNAMDLLRLMRTYSISGCKMLLCTPWRDWRDSLFGWFAWYKGNVPFWHDGTIDPWVSEWCPVRPGTHSLLNDQNSEHLHELLRGARCVPLVTISPSWYANNGYMTMYPLSQRDSLGISFWWEVWEEKRKLGAYAMESAWEKSHRFTKRADLLSKTFYLELWKYLKMSPNFQSRLPPKYFEGKPVLISSCPWDSCFHAINTTH